MLRAIPEKKSLRWSVLLVIASVMLCLGSCLGNSRQLEHFTVRIGKTVKIAASYGYCWFPTVHRFSTGEIFATMRLSPDDTNPEGEFSAYSLSKDGGQTWSRRYTIGAGGNTDAAYSQSPAEDGAIAVLGAGYYSLEPHAPNPKTDFLVALTKFLVGGTELNQVRDASIHLSEPVQLVPVELHATKQKDASRLEKVPAAQPYGAIVSGPGGEWLSTVYGLE